MCMCFSNTSVCIHACGVQSARHCAFLQRANALRKAVGEMLGVSGEASSGSWISHGTSAVATLSGDAKIGWGTRGRGGVALGTYIGHSHLPIHRCREAVCAFEARHILIHTTQ